MNKQEALNFIKKNTWAVASGPAVYQFCYPFMAGFMRMSKYYNEFYKSVFLIITNQVCYQYSIETQTFKNIKQLYDEPEKTKTLFNNWRKENKRFFEFCEKEVCALEKLDDNKLYLLYNSFLNYFIETWTPTLSVDVMGTYTETELLNNFLKAVKEGVKKAVNKTVNSRHLERRDTLKYFNELCQPTHISFVGKEHISILNLALLYKKEKDKFNLSNHFKNQLKEHQKNVYWIENNYRNIKTLDERYFLEKIKAESAKTKEQINEIIKDINENNLTEAEIAYFVSGCYEHELDSNEIVYFTEAIIKDLERLDLREKTIADKHCIGGLAGNRTTPIVVPIIAASGITIPNTSTRSITSAAGTTDVLEMLLPISHSKKEIKDILKITKACLVWDGNLNLHSAENKIIKIEKPVSLDCEGIMIASILAKKAALNATHILIDIPIGEETKMSSIKKSKHLKKKFIKLGKKLHMKVKVIITNGSQPIGNGIGPGLEARDVLLVLQNKGPKDLKEKSIKLAESLLKLCNKPKRLARQILESGEAYKKMQEIIKAQGGNPNIQPENIKLSKYKKTFYSQKKGKITNVD